MLVPSHYHQNDKIESRWNEMDEIKWQNPKPNAWTNYFHTRRAQSKYCDSGTCVLHAFTTTVSHSRDSFNPLIAFLSAQNHFFSLAECMPGDWYSYTINKHVHILFFFSFAIHRQLIKSMANHHVLSYLTFSIRNVVRLPWAMNHQHWAAQS